MTTLRKALKEGKLEQFIREHSRDPKGDVDKLDKALKKPASKTSKAVRPASSRHTRGD